MNTKLIRSIQLALATAALSLNAAAGSIVLNTDTSDPAPKAAFQAMIKDFEAAHPDIDVTLNLFDHEGYKTSIRNFLTADAPDVVAWYAGNRMLPYVNAGLFEPVNDVWDDNKLHKPLASSEGSMTIDGKIYGVPYTYYQWGVYYRKDLFSKLGIDVPLTWADFLAAGKTLKAAGITPITIGTKVPWTTGGIFDYLNMRTNGYEFHQELTRGDIPWTDKRVRATMAHWKELLDNEFFVDHPAAYSWQEALAPMVQGKAAMYVMGNFAVAPLREAGLTDDQLGFFQFPAITEGVALAEDAPTDTLHIPSNSSNKKDAKTFLAFVAQADTQTKINKALGQLPINAGSTVDDDPFLQAGFAMLNDTKEVAQFFDRDAPAEIAQAAMAGFQEFMAKPERLDKILKRLEKIRQRSIKKSN